jgi:hypothetical protein
MSCCGKKRSQFRTATRSGRVYVANLQSPPAKAVFTYVGDGTGMTVIGPATGVRYFFHGAGTKVEVDPRDSSMLARLRHLRQVK